MSTLRSSLTVFAAALYVLLGISASWHAPHFTRGDVSVGVDRHAEHEVSLDGESCALCSAKKSPHETGPASPSVVRSLRDQLVPSNLRGSVHTEPIGPWRARAPPSVS